MTDRQTRDYYDGVARELAEAYPDREDFRFYVSVLFGNVEFDKKDVLEIGGGSGALSVFVATQGAARVVCLEPDAQETAKGRNRQFQALVTATGARNVSMSSQTIQSFRSDSHAFDIVFTVNSVHHWEEEACRALQRDEQARRGYRTLFAKISDLLGDEGVQRAGLAPAATTNHTVEVRSVMGLALPQLNLRVEPLPLPYSPWGTSAAFDQLRERWIEVGQVLGSWVETIGATWRVAAELERTTRRVKALEHVIIPQYEADIRRIEHALEEQERDAFAQSKWLKQRKEAGSA